MAVLVWMAAETPLDNVGQTATSVPLMNRKATAVWIFVSLELVRIGKMKSFRRDA